MLELDSYLYPRMDCVRVDPGEADSSQPLSPFGVGVSVCVEVV